MGREHRVRDALRARPLLADGLLALGLLLTEVLLWLLGPAELRYQPWPVALGYSALGLCTVALRRRLTWLAVGMLAAHTALAVIWPRELTTEGTALVIVTYTVAAYRPLGQALLGTGLMWLPAIALVGLRFDELPDFGLPTSYPFVLTVNALIASVSFLAGRNAHHRRVNTGALEDRARAAESDQQVRTAQAVAEERRRIARELHDVVAHHAAVMGVLATGSRRTLQRDPGAADEALATIEETGRTALRELRRLLDVLRTDAEQDGELRPQPGLAGVPVLVDQVREAGLPVTLTVGTAAGPLEPGVELTVYRLVQEALTNTLKHAGSTTAEVRLDFGQYFLTVEVNDHGRGPRLGGSPIGHGLLGMRERVTLYGGTLQIGARSGGGFRVYARIPVESLDGGPDRRHQDHELDERAGAG